MSRRRKGITIGVGIVITWWVLQMIFPIMKCYDGCSCGYRRTWYEMPNSPWSHRGFNIVITNQGDTNHQHNVWDATWGVAYKLPWQK